MHIDMSIYNSDVVFISLQDLAAIYIFENCEIAIVSFKYVWCIFFTLHKVCINKDKCIYKKRKN